MQWFSGGPTQKAETHEFFSTDVCLFCVGKLEIFDGLRNCVYFTDYNVFIL